MNEAKPLIVVVDDDADIFPLVEEAFKLARVEARLRWFGEGGQLLAWLAAAQEFPALVLLDLNMPGMDGRQALARMRSDPALRRLPVIVLTSVDDDDEVLRCYEAGANTYVKKPLGFAEWEKTASVIGQYWLKTAVLPPAPGSR